MCPSKIMSVATTDTKNGFSCSVIPKDVRIKPLCVCPVVLYQRWTKGCWTAGVNYKFHVLSGTDLLKSENHLLGALFFHGWLIHLFVSGIRDEQHIDTCSIKTASNVHYFISRIVSYVLSCISGAAF